jgi:hypothetical protein
MIWGVCASSFGARLLQLWHHKGVKPKPEYIEGPEAWQRFDAAMHKIITVPHRVIQERIAEHKRQSALNPHRRGPKPKTTQ